MDLIYWLIFATVIAITPLYFIKKYIQTNNIIFLIVALVLYIVLIKSYIEIFQLKEISSSYTILQITQILLVVVGGIFIFNEKLTMIKIIGIICALTSVYLLLN